MKIFPSTNPWFHISEIIYQKSSSEDSYLVFDVKSVQSVEATVTPTIYKFTKVKNLETPHNMSEIGSVPLPQQLIHAYNQGMGCANMMDKLPASNGLVILGKTVISRCGCSLEDILQASSSTKKYILTIGMKLLTAL